MERIRDWIARSRHSSLRRKRRRADAGIDAPSIALIHFADRFAATAGETVSFTAWILNDSRETLTNVALVLRSFTNASLEKLSYDRGPSLDELDTFSLEPGESIEFGFTYVVRAEDVAHGGEIVSAMQVRAKSTGGILWDECDAIVQMSGTHRTTSHLRIPSETF